MPLNTRPLVRYESWTDGAALTLLRKLLVVVRAAGRGGEPLSRALQRLQHQPGSKDVRGDPHDLQLKGDTTTTRDATSAGST